MNAEMIVSWTAQEGKAFSDRVSDLSGVITQQIKSWGLNLGLTDYNKDLLASS